MKVENMLLLSRLKYRPTSRLPKLRNIYFRADHIGAGIIASELRKEGVNTGVIDIFDERVFEISGDYDIIGMSLKSIDATRASEIIGKLPDDKPIIVGGYHPTLYGDRLKEEWPGVIQVRGESEGLFGEILDDMRKGEPKSVYMRDTLPDMENEYVLPDREVLPKAAFFYRSVELGRGCHNACKDFCSGVLMQKCKPRNRKARDVIHEIEGLTGKRHILPHFLVFVDLNLVTYPREYLLEVFEFLSDRNIDWIGEGTLDALVDDYHNHSGEMLSLMGDNCVNYLTGVEDPGLTIDRAPDKNPVTSMEGIRILNEFGIPMTCSFLFGLDKQRYPDTFLETIDFIHENNIPVVIPQIATPHPGTKWFKGLEKEGRILTYDFGKYTHNRVVHEPRSMTSEELEDGYWMVVNKIYSPKYVYNRLFNGSGNHKRTFKKNIYNIPWNIDGMIKVMSHSVFGDKKS